MQLVKAKELAAAVKGKILSGNPETLIESISIDSRLIKRGQFFFAIKGERFDGNNFIDKALENGALGALFSGNLEICEFPSNVLLIKVEDGVAALGDFAKAYRKKFQNVSIAAITGSNAKTTTKEMLFEILSQRGKTLRSEGNLNNRIGLPLSILELDYSDKFAVFEMGTSLFGEIKTLADITAPQAALITNIGYSHLETFISPQGVYKEKIDLFNSIPDGGFIILNFDDAFLKNFKPRSNQKIISYSLNKTSANVYAKSIVLGSDKSTFEICATGRSIKISLAAKGEMNVLNAVAASAVSLAFDFSLDEIKRGLENFKMPQMRMQTQITKSKAIFINDAYNANPSSMKQAIKDICSTFANKEITLVLGDMLELGEASDKYHKEIGEFIKTQKIKNVYLIGEKMKNVKDVLGDGAFYTTDIDNLLSSIDKNNFNENTVVFFKASRGMKLEQIYKSLLQNNAISEG